MEWLPVAFLEHLPVSLCRVERLSALRLSWVLLATVSATTTTMITHLLTASAVAAVEAAAD